MECVAAPSTFRSLMATSVQDRQEKIRADLMDPLTLAALGRLEVVSRWIVDGLLAGMHRSPKKGFSVEFAEHRPYQPGDDLRFMDWKVAARADKWLIKQYEEAGAGGWKSNRVRENRARKWTNC